MICLFICFYEFCVLYFVYFVTVAPDLFSSCMKQTFNWTFKGIFLFDRVTSQHIFLQTTCETRLPRLEASSGSCGKIFLKIN